MWIESLGFQCSFFPQASQGVDPTVFFMWLMVRGSIPTRVENSLGWFGLAPVPPQGILLCSLFPVILNTRPQTLGVEEVLLMERDL